RNWSRPLIAAGAAAAVLAILGVIKVASANPNAEAFQRFWEPVFRSSDPLLLAVAHPLVYHPSSRAIKLSEESQPPHEIPLQLPIQLPAKALDGTDLVPVFNHYVGFDDMIAANEVSTMLARKSKGVRIRLANAIDFADLRKAQSVLIGAVTNRWTME